MALNAKQRRFVDEYLIDLNATQAAIRAGYSVSRASEIGYQLLQKTTVKEAIQSAMAKREKRTEITQDYVLNTIAETIEKCKQAEPVRDHEGKETGEYKFDAANVLRGCDLLGKHLGMFKSKIELTGKGGGPIQQHSMTTEEFREIAKGIADKV